MKVATLEKRQVGQEIVAVQARQFGAEVDELSAKT